MAILERKGSFKVSIQNFAKRYRHVQIESKHRWNLKFEILHSITNKKRQGTEKKDTRFEL